MENGGIKVLLVEDSESDARLLAESLAADGVGDIALSTTISLEGAREFLLNNPADAVLLDLTLPDSSGLETLGLFRSGFPLMPVVVLTGLENEKTGVDAVRMGAQDYLVKGQSDARLIARAVHYAIERKAAEEALRASEARFRSVLDNSRDVITRFNLKTNRYEYVSPSVEALTGYQPVDFMAMDAGSVFAMVHPEDLPALLTAQKQSEETGEAEAEYRQRAKDGTFVLLSNRMSVVKDDAGGPLYRDSTIRDITMHRKAEAALRQSREQYRNLVQNANSIIVEMDRSGAITFFNDYALRFFGYAPEEILGKNFKALVPQTETGTGRDLDEMVDVLLNDPDGLADNIHENVKKNGERVWISWRNRALKDENGVLKGNLALGQDITVRRRLEEERLQLLEITRLAHSQVAADLDAMTRLQKLGSMFVHEGNLRPILIEIVDAAIAISGADFGNIQLLDKKTGTLRIAASRNFPQWWLDYWESAGEGQGACGAALKRGARVVVENVEQSPIFKGTPGLDIHRKAGVAAVQSTPLLSRSGEPLGMFSTHYKKPHAPDDRSLRLLDLLARQAADIIERAGAQEELRESEAKANALVKYAPTGIYEIDYRVPSFLSVNDVMCKILGYTREELLAMSPAALLDDESNARFADRIKRQLAGQQIDELVEYRVRRKDGSFIFGLLNVSLLPEPGTALVVAYDITERKQAEQALHESEERFRQLAESSFEGLLIHANGAILDANRRLGDMLGHNVAEHIGKPILNFVDPKYHDTVIENVRGDYMNPYEIELVHSDGRRIPVEVMARQLSWKGREARVVAVRDITERKRAEDALRKSNEDLGRFNKAMVGRELRMVELKREINGLRERLGEGGRYKTDFAEPEKKGGGAL